MSNPILAAGARLVLEFRAGKMNFDGKMLAPDTRKGLLRVIRTEDGLLHVQWYERSDSGGMQDPEDDVIVFPDEASFQKASKGAQRVFLLRFTQELDRNRFFWMQEPEAAGDDALASRLHRAINSPLGVDEEDMLMAMEEAEEEGDESLVMPRDALEHAHMASGAAAGLEEVAGDSVGLVPQGPGQMPTEAGLQAGGPAAQLAALLSGMAQAGQAAAAQRVGRPNDPSASLAAALAAALARQQAGRGMAAAAGPSLAEVLKPEVLAPFLADEDVVDRLGAFLPEAHRNRQALADLAHSPQFQQQLATFGMALQTGQLDMAQFGLRSEGFTVADFLRAIQELVEREAAQGQKQ